MDIEAVSLFFQLCAHLRIKFGNVEAVGRIQIGKKTSHKKAASFTTLLGLVFARNKLLQ